MLEQEDQKVEYFFIISFYNSIQFIFKLDVYFGIYMYNCIIIELYIGLLIVFIIWYYMI